MPGRHQVDPEAVRSPEERPELDLAVAPGTWVRGAPGAELADEVSDHRPLELVAEVADLEREPRDAGRLRGVPPRRRPAASVLHALEVHERQVRAQDRVPLLVQEARGDGRIDATGHRDQDGRHPLRLPGTRRLPGRPPHVS